MDKDFDLCDGAKHESRYQIAEAIDPSRIEPIGQLSQITTQYLLVIVRLQSFRLFGIRSLISLIELIIVIAAPHEQYAPLSGDIVALAQDILLKRTLRRKPTLPRLR